MRGNAFRLAVIPPASGPAIPLVPSKALLPQATTSEVSEFPSIPTSCPEWGWNQRLALLMVVPEDRRRWSTFLTLWLPMHHQKCHPKKWRNIAQTRFPHRHDIRFLPQLNKFVKGKSGRQTRNCMHYLQSWLILLDNIQIKTLLKARRGGILLPWCRNAHLEPPEGEKVFQLHFWLCSKRETFQRIKINCLALSCRLNYLNQIGVFTMTRRSSWTQAQKKSRCTKQFREEPAQGRGDEAADGYLTRY